MSSCLPYHTAWDEYVSFYRIDSIPEAKNEKFLVNMIVYIVGWKDARIMFSEGIRPNNSVPVYEVILGGNNNSELVIRKRLMYTDGSPVDIWTRNKILFENEPNEVKIRITKSILNSL